jgi:hypothetical protein
VVEACLLPEHNEPENQTRIGEPQGRVHILKAPLVVIHNVRDRSVPSFA